MKPVWEERWHPLREEWVLVAAHRQTRPWSGNITEEGDSSPPPFDPKCYLCPGVVRASGQQNPNYKGTFVFDNDFACVGEESPTDPDKPLPPNRVRRADGKARVVCYHPVHNLTMAQFSAEQIAAVIHAWQEQYLDLGARPEVNHVLIFENKGKIVGTSNPHPHGQVYANNFVSRLTEIEDNASARYLEDTGRVLFQDILAAELKDGRRIVAQNDGAVVFVPYFARYAYETYVAPLDHRRHVAELTDQEVNDLAEMLRTIVVKYDSLWQRPFPYVMVLHNAPTDGEPHDNFGFHIEFYPPLRQPNLLKYLGGAELGGGNFTCDTSAEEKAEELRGCAKVHYLTQH